MSAWLLFAPALAVVFGLDLYLALIVLALAGRVEWIAQPPGALGDLASSWVVLPALGLYLAETLSELRPATACLWHAVQSLVRPLAAALLGLLLAGDADTLEAIASAVVVGAGAWLVHGVVRGWDLRRWLLESYGVAPLLRSGGLDAAAAGLLVLVLDFPRLGAVAGAAGLILLLGAAGWLTRVSRFGVHLAWSAAWSLDGRGGWRDPERLPGWAAGRGPDEEAAPPGTRACRVGAFGLGAAGRFRSGWLVVDDEGCRFRYRRLGGPETEGLGTVSSAMLEGTALFDRLRLAAPAARDGGSDSEGDGAGRSPDGDRERDLAQLVLPRGGPEPELVRDAVAGSTRPGERRGSVGESNESTPRNPAASPG